MKRITAILCALLAVLLLFASCTREPTPKETPAGETTENTTAVTVGSVLPDFSLQTDKQKKRDPERSCSQ